MTQPNPIYNLRSLADGAFMMAKFDEDFCVAATYTLTPSRNGHYSCDCPAGSRAVVTKLCKHRRMLPLMIGAVNTDRFYEPEHGAWCEPLGDLFRPTADPVGQEALQDASEASEIQSSCACFTEDECDRRKGCQVEAREASMDKTASSIVGKVIRVTVEPEEIVDKTLLHIDPSFVGEALPSPVLVTNYNIQEVIPPTIRPTILRRR